MTPKEKSNCCEECRPDFQREYYRLIEEVKKLKNENYELKNTLLGICKTLFREND